MNWALKDLLESPPGLANTSVSSSSAQRCAECDDAATWYCFTDDANLCEQHKVESHKSPIHQKHRMCPIADKLKQQRAQPPRCEEHDARMVLWCDCGSLCCPTCASHGEHTGHKTKLIKDAAQGLKAQSEAQVKQTREYQPELEAEAARLLALEHQLTQQLNTGSKAINDACDALIRTVETQRQELVNTLESKTKAAVKQLHMRMLDLSLCRSQVSVALELSQACLALPEHELLQRYGEVVKAHQTSERERQQYAQQPALVSGFVVEGLGTTDVAKLADVRFPEKKVDGVAKLNQMLEAEEEEKDVAAPCSAPGSFVRTWGSEGSGEGQFKHPGDVCVANGLVYVTDHSNNRLQVFTEAGVFVRTWGSPKREGQPQFLNPEGVCVANGLVYVADREIHGIWMFTEAGAFVRTWGSPNGQLMDPDGVCVANGLVYVTGFYDHCIQVFTEEGAFLRKWGSEGAGQGQFMHPAGVCVANGHVYVADSGNSRIQVFTEGGAFVRMWGAEGADQGQFQYPVDVCVANGLVYVVDCHRIQVFTEAGAFVRTWGSPNGEGHGQLMDPVGVCVANGLVYVVDGDNHCVQVFKE